VSLVRILLMAVALHVASTGIGALLLLPARGLAPTLRRAIRPLGGLVLVPLLVWWWVQWAHRPVRELAWPIRIVAVVGVVVLAREQWSRRPTVARGRLLVRRSLVPVLVLGFFYVVLHPLAHQPAMTASSDTVADAPFYSIVATSLLDDLPTRTRGIEAYDAHHVYRIDHHGAYGLLAGVSAATGLRTVSVQWSVLVAAVLGMAAGLASVTRLVFRSSWLGELAVVGAALGSYLSVYMLVQFPLGQVLGLSFLPGLLVALVFLARARSRHAFVGATLATWIAFDGVFRSYLFILPAFVPFLVLCILATVRRPWRWAALVRPAVGLAIAGIITVVLAPDGALEQFRRFSRAADAPNGWSIAQFRPMMLFGFMRQFENFAGWGRVLFELAVVVVVCIAIVAAVRAERRRRALFGVGAVFATLVAYALYYRSKGESYQQWKLAVSFCFIALPLLWGALVEALRDLVRRVPAASRHALIGAAVLVVPLLAAVGINGRRLHARATIVVAHPEALQLAASWPVACAPIVQVASDDQVDENWLVYAFLDRVVRPIRTSYFGELPAEDLPTVWTAIVSTPTGVTVGGDVPVEMNGTIGFDARAAQCARSNSG
jgi:hypothetical protein